MEDANAKDLNAPKEGLQLGIGVGIQKEFFGTVGKYLWMLLLPSALAFTPLKKTTKGVLVLS